MHLVVLNIRYAFCFANGDYVPLCFMQQNKSTLMIYHHPTKLPPKDNVWESVCAEKSLYNLSSDDVMRYEEHTFLKPKSEQVCFKAWTSVAKERQHNFHRLYVLLHGQIMQTLFQDFQYFSCHLLPVVCIQA